MFVEQLFWKVPREQGKKLQSMFDVLHRDMDASGGLISAQSGWDINCAEQLMSLTFWKGWEDLSRFLASPRANLLAETRLSQHDSQRPRPHHFESIWQNSDDATATRGGASTHWSILDFSGKHHDMEVLFDYSRHAASSLAKIEGFLSAQLWLDKNDEQHGALALEWSLAEAPAQAILDSIVAGSSPTFPATSCRWYIIQLHAPKNIHASARS